MEPMNLVRLDRSSVWNERLKNLMSSQTLSHGMQSFQHTMPPDFADLDLPHYDWDVYSIEDILAAIALFQQESPINNSLPSSDFKMDMESPEPSRSAKPQSKSDHKVVEQRYRQNLNSKFAELRKMVPCLRAEPEGGSHARQSAVQNSYISRSTVLAKASEYIQELERDVRVAQDRFKVLQRITQLLMASARNSCDSIVDSEGGQGHAQDNRQ